MGIAALMLTAGIFLVMAGIRDQSIPSIVADVIGGRVAGAGPASEPAKAGPPGKPGR